MPPARIALWVASLGGIALLARTLLVDPIPLWVAVAALVGYLALATVGVLVPRLEMFGDVFWHGDRSSKVVALTFDDGPHPVTTRQILRILEGSGHRATFFVVGRKVRVNADVVREIHEAGHALGLHGYQHDRLYALKSPSYVRADIERTQNAVEDACGVRPTLFRPPIGHVSARTAAAAKKAGVTIVGWSARGLDGVRGADPDRVRRRIEAKLEPGAIVLLHDAAERDDFSPASLEVLPKLLQTIEKRGLEVATLEDLASAR